MAEELYFYTSAEVAGLLRLNVQVVQRKLQAGRSPATGSGRSGGSSAPSCSSGSTATQTNG